MHKKLFFLLVLSILFTSACSEKIKIKQVESQIEANSDYNLLNLIEYDNSIATVQVIDNSIDISKIGKYEVTYQYITNNNISENISFSFNVVDTTPPNIYIYPSITSVEKLDDTSINWVNYVSFRDDYDGYIPVENMIISPNITIETLGEQTFNLCISDSSGNISTIDITVNVLLPENERIIMEILSQLQDTLRDPSSLDIHSIMYEHDKNIRSIFYYVFKIDYSAKNGFGGMNRETLYVALDKSQISSYGIFLSSDDFRESYWALSEGHTYTITDEKIKFLLNLSE